MAETTQRTVTSKAAVWRGIASGMFLLAAMVWSIVHGRGDAAAFAGLAAMWAFLYAARCAQLRDTETALEAIKGLPGRRDATCDGTGTSTRQ